MSKQPKRQAPKPRGYVVDHRESPVRYAVSPANYNPKQHVKVRELVAGESVAAFKPKRTTPKPVLAPQAPAPAGSHNTETK